jgi:hypothetical protein
METLLTPFQDHLDHDRHAVLRHHLLRLVQGGEDLARLEHADGLAAESLDDPDVVDAVRPYGLANAPTGLRADPESGRSDPAASSDRMSPVISTGRRRGLAQGGLRPSVRRAAGQPSRVLAASCAVPEVEWMVSGVHEPIGVRRMMLLIMAPLGCSGRPMFVGGRVLLSGRW